jgi:hypothetical protein
MARHLLSLPKELLRLIASFLSSYKDLKALCLTCFAIHGQAREELYASIVLSIEQVTRFDPSNSGLQHVQTFRVIDCGVEFDQERHADPLRRLLSALPWNKLEFIHLGTFARVTSEIYGIIHFRQRKLRNLVLYPETFPGLQPWSSGQGLDNIVIMEIQIAHNEAFELGKFLLERTPRLRELTLRSPRYFIGKGLVNGHDESFFVPLLSAKGELIQLDLRKLTLYGFELSWTGFCRKAWT